MAGLHLSCGQWLGGDKHADPFFEVLSELGYNLVPSEREAWTQQVERFFGCSLADPTRLQIPPDIVRLLAKPAWRYRGELAEILGLSNPDAAVEEIVAFPSNRNAPEFHYRCVVDLLRAVEECERSGEPVTITFC